MPSQKPRVALTMPDDLNELFNKISDLNGMPKTKLIIELLESYKPVLIEMLNTLERIESDKENAKKIVREFGHTIVVKSSEVLGDISKEVQKL